MNNLPDILNINYRDTLLKLKIGSQQYTIRGYSRAGLCTSILIEEFNVVFDMGYAHDKSHTYDNKLISHGHCDHIGALHIDHCTRKLNNINKNQLYIMPNNCINPFKLIISGFSALNRGLDNIKLIQNLVLTNIISSEDCINNYQNLINSKYYVKSVLMNHNICSYGYIIYRKSSRLKQEFLNLSPNEIVQIKENQNDIILTYDKYTPLIAYTGDTTIDSIINNDELLNVPLLIMECTGFSYEDINFTHIGKHIHFNDIIVNSNKFNNEKIILFHFSQKYKKLDDIKDYIIDTPNNLSNKLLFFF
jgi:ribonuclease Z